MSLCPVQSDLTQSGEEQEVESDIEEGFSPLFPPSLSSICRGLCSDQCFEDW